MNDRVNMQPLFWGIVLVLLFWFLLSITPARGDNIDWRVTKADKLDWRTCCPTPSQAKTDYTAASAKAIKDGMPLVVGIMCDPPRHLYEGTKWYTVRVEKLPGFYAPCVVVSVPSGGYLKWVDVLPSNTTSKDVEDMLGRIRKALGGSLSPGEGVTPQHYHQQMMYAPLSNIGPPYSSFSSPMPMFSGGGGGRC